MIAADPGEELESHWFIENFMVLANEQVASFLEREHVPTVYRVHDLPDPFRLDHLLDVLSSLGLPTPRVRPHDWPPPQDIRRVTRETAEWVDRCTPRRPGQGGARAAGAAGAGPGGLPDRSTSATSGWPRGTYCHFTSPIRRYPDLLVHRGLLGQLGLGPEPDHGLPGRLGRALLARPSARPPRSN